MKVLITGINGFVGRNIAKNLMKLGISIYGTGRQNFSNNDYCLNYIKAELGTETFLNSFNDMNNIDAIIHVAANLSKNNYDKSLIDTNCYGTLQIAELAKKLKVKTIIYISGVPIIGTPKDIPITENHEISPLTLYHATKIFGEYVFNLLQLEGINVINLRLPSPIGADMPPNKIFSVFVDKCLKNEPIQLLGKGARIQNYIDVQDVAQAVYKSLHYNKSNIFNISADKSYSNFELAQICIEELNSKSIISFNGIDKDENLKWIIDNSKAKKELEFKPIISIQESIKNRKQYHENTCY